MFRVFGVRYVCILQVKREIVLPSSCSFVVIWNTRILLKKLICGFPLSKVVMYPIVDLPEVLRAKTLEMGLRN
jgi:hypothetical protein